MANENVKIYRSQGGDTETFESGATLNAQAGSAVNMAGTNTMSGTNNLTGTNNLAGVNFDVAAPAAAGTTQANGTALTATINAVTGADGNKGVVLPTAVAGKTVIVHNTSGASALKIYGAADAQKIDGTGGATAYSLAAGKRVIFICTAVTDWITVLGA